MIVENRDLIDCLAAIDVWAKSEVGQNRDPYPRLIAWGLIAIERDRGVAVALPAVWAQWQPALRWRWVRVNLPNGAIRALDEKLRANEQITLDGCEGRS